MNKAVLASIALYVTLALLILRQWSGGPAWERLTIFSATALATSVALAAAQLWLGRQMPSDSLRAEVFGMSYDPAFAKWGAVLGLAELLAYAEYAHWRLVPTLEEPFLQVTGVLLCGLAVGWTHWVDRRLASRLRDPLGHTLMTSGPFRFVRHPRYAGFALSRVALALTLSSVVGWLCVIAWVIVIRTRIRREEPHLARIFGPAYEEYVSRSYRLVPHLY